MKHPIHNLHKQRKKENHSPKAPSARMDSSTTQRTFIIAGSYEIWKDGDLKFHLKSNFLRMDVTAKGGPTLFSVLFNVLP